MKIIKPIVIFVIISSCLYAQNEDYKLKAYSYVERGDFEQAIIYFNKAIELNPKDYWLRGDLGVAHFYKGEYSKAIECYKSAIKINSKYNIAMYNLACVNSKLNLKKESLHWLRNALKNGFNDFDQIKKDEDLINIRNTVEYKELVYGVKEKREVKPRIDYEKEEQKKVTVHSERNNLDNVTNVNSKRIDEEERISEGYTQQYQALKKCSVSNNRLLSFQWLGAYFRAGFTDFNLIKSDTSLINVVHCDQFKLIFKEYFDKYQKRGIISESKIKSSSEFELKYTFGSPESKSIKKYTTFYNIDGSIKSKIMYTDNGKTNWKWEYSYDKNLNLVQLVEYDYKNKVMKLRICKYDGAYNVLEDNYYEYIDEKQYNKDNRVVVFKKRPMRLTEQYTFNYDEYYNLKQAYSVVSSYSQQIQYNKNIFSDDKNVMIEFNHRGKPITRNIYLDENSSLENKLFKKIVYQYDDDIKLISEIEYDDYGKVSEKIIYVDKWPISQPENYKTYRYQLSDNAGNVIKDVTQRFFPNQEGYLNSNTYTQYGQLLKSEERTKDYESITSYDYDDSFKILSYKHSMPYLSEEAQYIYDSNNNLISEKTLTRIYSGGTWITASPERIWRYDANGRIVESRDSKFSYDSKGNIEEEIHLSKDGEIEYVTKYAYEYYR